MKAPVLFITLFLVTVLVCSSPIDPKRHFINRPTFHHIFQRSAPVKGGNHYVKGYHPTPTPNVRKGEYMCGNRVCKLKPGEAPWGCNGVCQYPI